MAVDRRWTTARVAAGLATRPSDAARPAEQKSTAARTILEDRKDHLRDC
jgi:hypothetical protein